MQVTPVRSPLPLGGLALRMVIRLRLSAGIFPFHTSQKKANTLKVCIHSAPLSLRRQHDSPHLTCTVDALPLCPPALPWFGLNLRSALGPT